MAVITGYPVAPGVLARGGSLATAEGIEGAAVRVVRARYDFAADGGAVGTIALLGATSIPSGAVILGGWLDVLTILASGGSATAALRVEGAGDIIAATAFGSSPWSSTGRKSVVPAFTGATSVQTTAARDVSLVIAVAALTAGKFDAYLVYIETA